jgi:hypothetical protein
MEIIKRKILLEDYISRADATWGTPKWDIDPKFSAFTLNVMFTQDTDDMGIVTDLEYIPNPSASFINDPLSPDTRLDGKGLDDYFFPGLSISGYSEDRLDTVKSYDPTERFKVLFNMDSEVVDDFQGNQHTSVSRVVSNANQMPITYIDGGDASESINVNNPDPQLGIFFKTYSGRTRLVTSSVFGDYNTKLTEIYYKGQGFNNTNTTLSAITKEEYLFGITTKPTVFSDVFIERGRNTVLQSHMQLSEIVNMDDLINYGNGFYKIQK